jgi:hypothetical protein
MFSRGISFLQHCHCLCCTIANPAAAAAASVQPFFPSPQVITWHKMFSREVRLREAMKRIISVMWQSGVAPAASGYTANDVIIGLESGVNLFRFCYLCWGLEQGLVRALLVYHWCIGPWLLCA